MLFEDAAILVVNKPAGIASVHDGMRQEEDLQTQLVARHGALWVVHRLDRDTSGVLAFARTAEAHAALSAQFESRAAAKVYHAIVLGAPRWSEHVVDAPLRPDGDRRHRTVADAVDGKPSLTRFKLLTQLPGYALVEARPETGRTHQVRAHLSLAGHAVAVDELYGDGQPILLSAYKRGYRGKSDHEERPLLGRLGLHALSLALTHPVTGEPLICEAPIPKDIGATLNQLAKLGPNAAIIHARSGV